MKITNKSTIKTSILLFLIVSFSNLLISPNALSEDKLTLEEVIKIAQNNSPAFQAVELKIQSLVAEIKSRELVLSSTLSGEISGVNVEQENIDSLEDINNNSEATGQYALFDSLYIKPFDTGSELALGVSHNLGDNNLRNFDENEADWELRLSQSLWRDSFGKGTDLRRKSEEFEYRSRFLSAIDERQEILLDIEYAFWDLVLSNKEVSIQKANLDRSRKLLEWMKERVAKFAAEDVDLLQAETLLSERELDLSIAIDAKDSAVSKLRELIPNFDPLSWSIDLVSLEKTRPPLELVAKSELAPFSDQPILISAAALENRATQLEIDSDRVEDSLKPDLSAFVSYGANGANDGFYDSWVSGVEGDSNSARLGLRLSVQLDTSLKQEKIKAARLNAASEKSRFMFESQQSKESWADLNRSILSLRAQVDEARRLSNLQNKKVSAEKERFEQGRSTTFQMVSFEIDANVSELRLYRLLAALRKTESRARAYVLAGV